jgi:phosphohistidine phosphatase
MQLYVVRHGPAVAHGIPGMGDDDRPLTPDGEKKVKAVGRGLSALGLRLDRIVTSPLPRARRTAEILAGELGAEGFLAQDDALRSGRSAESIRDWLVGRNEQSLMIVGHNPDFSDLVGLLVTGRSDVLICELRKGGVAALEGRPSEIMTFDWLAGPKLLRALEG